MPPRDTDFKSVFKFTNIRISLDEFQRYLGYPSNLLMPYAVWVGTLKGISKISLQKRSFIPCNMGVIGSGSITYIGSVCRSIRAYYFPYLPSSNK